MRIRPCDVVIIALLIVMGPSGGRGKSRVCARKDGWDGMELITKLGKRGRKPRRALNLRCSRERCDMIRTRERLTCAMRLFREPDDEWQKASEVTTACYLSNGVCRLVANVAAND
ncbi:hypothetical protein LZ30DRAFT_732582 [Colletotrichum cereale]|nr:hypothetical protein LZ30DRAFT_732582 [Colletotrichum cereale]